MTYPEVARQFQVTNKRQECVVPQWFGWSSHSLAYEFIQLLNLATPHSMALAPALCDGSHPVECASLWIWTNPLLTHHYVSNLIFVMRHQRPSFIRSWSQAPCVLAGLKFQERGAEGQEEKTVGKMCQGIPFITCWKIAKYLTYAHSFHLPDPWHKED